MVTLWSYYPIGLPNVLANVPTKTVNFEYLLLKKQDLPDIYRSVFKTKFRFGIIGPERA